MRTPCSQFSLSCLGNMCDYPRTLPDNAGAGSDWHHSTFDSEEVLQSSNTKVHVAVRFTRWDGQDNIIATYNSLYIMNCVDGHWGIQARSSFAP